MQEFHFNDRIALIIERFGAPWEVVGNIVYDGLGSHHIIQCSLDDNADGMLEPVQNGDKILIDGRVHEILVNAGANNKVADVIEC